MHSPRSRRIDFSRQVSALVSVLAIAASLGCAEPASRGPAPDVLLVTIDTLRADHLHSYGFAHPTTPNIDALAAEGALFELALAASTATVPSHASIMTSRYVREHSVGASNGPTRLEGLTTLAERFQEAGYDTAAFVSNVVLKARSGLDLGFGLYDDELPEAERNRAMYLERTAEETGERAIAWLEPKRDTPFFLWVHLQDPHGPYTPPPPFDAARAGVPLRVERPLPVMSRNRGKGGLPHYQELDENGGEHLPSRYAGLYAGEVAFTDAWVGKLLEAARRNAERDLVVLLTADHGESIDERGFFFQHGHGTTPEQARVPFIVVAPGISPGRPNGPVSHVDVAPTLLELAGLPALRNASGVSLAPHLRRGEALPTRSVLTDIGSELTAYDGDGFVTVKIAPRRSQARARGSSPQPSATHAQPLAWQRFDWVGEPGGLAQPARSAARKRELPLLPSEIVAYLSAEVPLVAASAMTEGDLERLRALGYLAPHEAKPGD
jgi:arylsulfatase A-like enzyme